MPSRRRRPNALPDARAAEVVRALRACRDVLVHAAMHVSPCSPASIAKSTAVVSMCRAADAVTGVNGYFLTGTSATAGQLAEAEKWRRWEAGENRV